MSTPSLISKETIEEVTAKVLSDLPIKKQCDVCGFEFMDGRDINKFEHICNDGVRE